MNKVALTIAAAILCSADASASLLSTYTSQFDFQAAAGPTVLEDFQGISTGTSFGTFTGPLDSTTSNSIVSPGDIVPGLTIQSSSGTLEFVQYQPWVVGPAGDTMELLFQPGVQAVGLDVGLSFLGHLVRFSPTTLGPSQINVYGASNTLLGGVTNTTSLFNGFVADGVDIRRITVEFSETIGIDNVEFASAPSISTPEPSTWALLLAGLTLAAIRSRKA